MTKRLEEDSTDILIVEDSRTQAEQLQAMLEHHRYQSRIARDGLQALTMLKERKPILVISDINMPEIDGYELCRRIRADPVLADLPVILLTSLSDPEDVVRGLESGADNFVIKPPDEDYLISRVAYIMANRHLRPRETTRISLEIQLGGRKHQINADRLQMLHLLLSTYESAVLRGKQLAQAKNELRAAYEGLEEKIRERTEALSREIAERTRLHEQLQRSEENYRQLFASNPMPMWVYDVASLRFLAVNDAAVRHYGYSREEFLNMTIAEIRPPAEAAALLRHLQEDPSDLRADVWKHRKKNGELIEVEITGHELPFEGRSARLILAHDITERRRAEEARRWSEERFRAIFSAAPVGIALGTLEGQVIDANPEMCRTLGFSRDEMIGRTTQELLLWAEPEARQALRKKLLAEKAVRNYEAKVRRKSGEIRAALVSMEMLQVDRESLVLTMLVDVTDRKALEAQLHRAQREESVGRLASGIAHDMNNILAPIMMSAPLLRMGMAPNEVESVLTTIETSAQRGAALVRQLLIFGRGIEGERRTLRVESILTEVATIAERTFPRNITIVTSVPEDVWPVRGDATQLHQVMLNLAVNARDAMPDGGTLTLSTENIEIDSAYTALHPDARAGRYTLIRVADTGVGISPEIADRIFDPFFTTKEEGKGTGLGLSMVSGIVKSHGGFVRLQSELGHGTKFEVYLPVSERADEIPAQRKETADIPQGKGETILVVDDEEFIRSVVRDTLARHNYKVVTARDGVEATAVCASTPDIKLVITDLDMPLMNGIDLGRVLRRLKPEMKIVVSTGMDRRSRAKQRQDELDSLNISALLMKPYRAEELLCTVHEALASAEPPSKSAQ